MIVSIRGIVKIKVMKKNAFGNEIKLLQNVNIMLKKS